MASLKEKTKVATSLKKGDVVLTAAGWQRALEVKVHALYVSVWVRGTIPSQHRTVYDYRKKEMVHVR